MVIAIRKAKLPDPKVQGNAGSFFMNPVVSREVYEAIKGDYPDVPHYEVDAERVKIPAGWLIERCGWKGRSLGRAAVHDRQALVLVNKGGATGRDILALCEAVRADVLFRFGISISPEVNIIGGCARKSRFFWVRGRVRECRKSVARARCAAVRTPVTNVCGLPYWWRRSRRESCWTAARTSANKSCRWISVV